MQAPSSDTISCPEENHRQGCFGREEFCKHISFCRRQQEQAGGRRTGQPGRTVLKPGNLREGKKEGLVPSQHGGSSIAMQINTGASLKHLKKHLLKEATCKGLKISLTIPITRGNATKGNPFGLYKNVSSSLHAREHTFFCAITQHSATERI